MLALGFTLALTVAMAAVVLYDSTRYLIPNPLNGAILLLWLIGIFFLPIDPWMSLAAAAVVLVVGLGFFALGLMGGGDIKLLVVLTLWTGWSMLTVHFLMLTAIMGGVLVVVMLVLRAAGQTLLRGHTLPRFFTPKQPVPYGLAIAAAFLLLLWRGMIPALS